MSNLVVDFRIDLVLGHRIEELDETIVAERIATGDIAALREERALDGRLRIGDAEIFDELTPVVHMLCFNAVSKLATGDTIVDYHYFSSNETVQLRATGDAIILSGSDRPELTFPREILRAMYACGVRWIAMLDRIGRGLEADRLRPVAAATRVALVSAGLEP